MNPQSSPVDHDLQHAAWQQAEQLLDEIAAWNASVLPASEYYQRLLAGLISACGAAAAGLWKQAGNGTQLQAQTPRMSRDELIAPRAALVEQAIAMRTACASTSAPETWPLIVAIPLSADVQPPMAIELCWSEPGAGARAASYQRILAAAAELVEDFQRRQDLGKLRSAAEGWQQYEQFSRRAHASLELEPTAYAIANEARDVVGCDRVSVLVHHGRRQRVEAISGVDVVERRSQLVRSLELLGERVAATAEPVWYHDGVADLPPQVADPLDAYLELSHARVLALLPLVATDGDHETRPAHVVGLLVAECFQAQPAAHVFRDRVQGVAPHAQLALQNAVRHSRRPLARTSNLLARLGWLAERKQRPWTVFWLLLAAAIGAALALVPADFKIEARGELQPIERRDVFASDDGTVSELLVQSGARVGAGQPLVVLRKPELELELRRVLGETETAEKRLAAVRAERLQDTVAGLQRRRDPHELAAEEAELRATLDSLSQQQALLDEQQRALTLRSAIDGQTLTWNVDQLLAARPVQRGQALLTVADVDGPWILQLRVADDRAGHVLAAQAESEEPLRVDFRLPSEPDRVYAGEVVEIAPTTELDAKHQPSVLVRVAFDRQQVPALRPGATAVAHLYCGRRSIGYVWLHDVYEHLQSWWW